MTTFDKDTCFSDRVDAIRNELHVRLRIDLKGVIRLKNSFTSYFIIRGEFFLKRFILNVFPEVVEMLEWSWDG